LIHNHFIKISASPKPYNCREEFEVEMRFPGAAI
jgi:hypothetical protein